MKRDHAEICPSTRSLTHLLDLGERQAMPDRTCSVDGCESPLECRGWCNKHYLRWRKYGDPLKLRERPTCSIQGCEEVTKGRGLCAKHYVHWRSHRAEGERCVVDDCDRAVYARGWCRLHYERVLKHGDSDVVLSGGKPGGRQTRTGRRAAMSGSAALAGECH